MNTLPIEKPTLNIKDKSSAPAFYYLMAIITVCLIGVTFWLAYPYFLIGYNQWPKYINVNWAHNSQLLGDLLRILGLVWFLVSVVFWGSWLLKRVFRKISGLQWKIPQKKQIASTPVFRYLKYSCNYLMLVLLFFILQYPIQFILFT